MKKNKKKRRKKRKLLKPLTNMVSGIEVIVEDMEMNSDFTFYLNSFTQIL